jgi:AcrR family transcriptional regulator
MLVSLTSRLELGERMDSNIADTRQHILDVTAAMFSENRSKLRIKDIAKTSGVGIPTLYYHFKSKSQLFAEAQAQNYMKASQQLHTHLSRAESAMEERDEPGFWTAVGENMVLAWTSGRPNDSWAIIKMLLDVWADPRAKQKFLADLDHQFDRWIKLIDSARVLGWIDQNVDAETIIASFWPATIGQVIIAGSTRINPSPERVRDFFLHAIGGKAGAEKGAS